MAAKAATQGGGAKEKTAQKGAGKKAAPPARETPFDDVRLTASVELGRRLLSLDEALSIGEQSLLELDGNLGDAAKW